MPVSPVAKCVPMVAPFELVMKDSALQENWFRRIVAAVIDGILLGIVYAVLSVIVFAGWLVTGGLEPGFRYGYRVGGLFGFGIMSLLLMLIWIVYFAFTESFWGASIGKMLLSLKVVGENGEKPLIPNAFIRNISRIHGLIFLLDLIGGLIMEGDPRQRFSDRYAKTVVYHAKSTREGPFVEPKILTLDEASATAGTGVAPPTTTAQPEAPPAGEKEKPAEEAKAPAPATTEGKTFCRHCGAPVKGDSKFCPKCGKEL